MDEPALVTVLETTALRSAIEGADVAAEFRTAFLSSLTARGIFAGATIDTAQLSQAIHQLWAQDEVEINADFGTVMGGIALLKRPPILDEDLREAFVPDATAESQ
ncbi:MAG: hypothetical protein WAT81_02195 [Candidatus Moraniibacteriota bacterium]